VTGIQAVLLRVSAGRRSRSDCALYLPIPDWARCLQYRSGAALPDPYGQRCRGAIAPGPVPHWRGRPGYPAVSCSLAQMWDAVRHVVSNVLSPVVAAYAADDRAKEEAEHPSAPYRLKLATAVPSYRGTDPDRRCSGPIMVSRQAYRRR